MFENLIYKKRYDCSAYLQMLKKLFPFGPLWKFTIGNCSETPDWVTMDTYISDDFSAGSFDPWWNPEFRDTGSGGWSLDEYPPASGNYSAVLGADAEDELTPSGFYIPSTSEFQLDWEVITGASSGGNDSVRFELFDYDTDTLIAQVYVTDNIIRWCWPGFGDIKDSQAIVWSAYRTTKLRIARDSAGTITAYYDIGSGWVAMANPITGNSDRIYMKVNGADKNGINSLELQADAGFPTTVSSGLTYSTLGILMSCFALELNRFEEKAIELLNQVVPGLSTDAELLTDWESMLGLPDECLASVSQTEAQRAATAHAKYTQNYTGMSTQFYIDYAASLGSDISITGLSTVSNQPFRANGPVDIDETRVEPHTSPGGSTGTENLIPGRVYSLQATYQWQVNGSSSDPNKDIIECIFEKLKPAYTTIVFNWT